MSSLRRSVGWIPAVFLTVAALVAWGFFWSGAGMRSVLAWLALQTALPPVAVLVALVAGAAAIWRRRAGRRFWVTLAVCGGCAWPAAWLIGVGNIVFPFRLDRVRPQATVRLPGDAPMRVVWGGDELAHNRHASFPKSLSGSAMGNTSEPHIHIHVQRQDPRDRPVNFSEGLPLFFRDHDGRPMPHGGIAWIEGKPRPTGDVVRHTGPSTGAGAGTAHGAALPSDDAHRSSPR